MAPKETKELRDLRQKVTEQQEALNLSLQELGQKIVFVPSWRQIEAKLLIQNHKEQFNHEAYYYTAEKIAEIGEVSIHTYRKWVQLPGFRQWFWEPEEFQVSADRGALRVLRRLEQLAFNEAGNAAVAACRAYLDMTSFKKERVEVRDEIGQMNEKELDAEIAKEERKLKAV